MVVLLFSILPPQIQILNLNGNMHMIRKKGYIEKSFNMTNILEHSKMESMTILIGRKK